MIAPSGGTTWTRIMFERQVLGEDYWKKQAATQPIALSLRRAAVGRAGARRGLDRAAALQHHLSEEKDGAPVEIFFPPEGVPVIPTPTGIPKTAANPNAAKLFLNWRLSEEGQTFMIKEHGNLTSLKEPPVYPEGLRSRRSSRCGCRSSSEFVKLHEPWVEDWNKTYGYRQ